ncbi:MAG: hypothetical protein G8237_06810 [Magnetococcales bacterium]|nr:hypothetical protein [Magnetococcales bacterium]NGZ06051.1 hypothetical protein [Magnetococcales bacterium]
MKAMSRILYLTALGLGLAGCVTSGPESAATDVEPVAARGSHYAAQLSKAVPAPDGGLQAVRVAGKGALLDPFAKEWDGVKPVTVAMQPQVVATPNQPNPAVTELSVRSLHNGHWLGVLLEWKDGSKSDRLVVDRFGDQVAVELPVIYRADSAPNPMMGAPGERVNIIQWRAAFQADLERKRELSIKDNYPNAASDLYPDQVLKTLDLRSYMGAAGVDNPVAKHRESPVLDQVAEGFGTLTTKPHQEADGRGVWKNGVWRVVITTPMSADGANAPRLIPGDHTVVAFAVWEGAAQEVGARKSWSDWVPLKLAR